MDNFNSTLNEIKKESGGYGKCRICDKKDVYTVCVYCDGIITALRVFRAYFTQFRYYLKYYISKQQLSDVGIQHMSKEERNKVIDEIRANPNFANIKRLYSKDIGGYGVDGLDEKEKKVYKEQFAKELKKLEEDRFHMARVMKYSIENDTIFGTHHDDCEELRNQYMFKREKGGDVKC